MLYILHNSYQSEGSLIHDVINGLMKEKTNEGN